MTRMKGNIFAVLAVVVVLLLAGLYVAHRSYMAGGDDMANEWILACQKGELIPINDRVTVRCAEVKEI